MANSLTIENLQEGPRNLTVKVTGVLDTTDLALSTFIDPASYNQGGTGPTPEQLRIDSIEYNVDSGIKVLLYWDATTDVLIMPLVGFGEMPFRAIGGMTNSAGAGKTGIILGKTLGYTSGTVTFTLILTMVKQGADL